MFSSLETLVSVVLLDLFSPVNKERGSTRIWLGKKLKKFVEVIDNSEVVEFSLDGDDDILQLDTGCDFEGILDNATFLSSRTKSVDNKLKLIVIQKRKYHEFYLEILAFSFLNQERTLEILITKYIDHIIQLS